MKQTRREFLESATYVGLAAFLGGASSAEGSDFLNLGGLLAVPSDDPDGEVGKPYRGWREGEFDINFIHTGVGENCFQIFPDGTTALVDAGDRNAQAYKDAVPILPNDSRRPGEWIARYVSRVKPGLETIDYVVASHFHDDHTGNANDGAGIAEKGGYQLSGIAQVGEFYRFGQAFDRGYPNYDYPVEKAPKEREHLRRFFDYQEKANGLKREKFEVGALDQISLKNAPEKYDFHIRNVCANAVLWTGEGDKTFDYFGTYPKNKEASWINENTMSLVTLTSFGPFRFYSGGDASGVVLDNDGKDVDFEGAIGRVVGPVDVCKSNHHSYKDAMRPTFVKAVQPRVYVTCVWDRWHLQDNTATAMTDVSLYPGPRLICPTTIHPGNAELMEGKAWRESLSEQTGTVVVKAYDGGKKYKIYYIAVDAEESMRVEAVYGPFDSKLA